MLQVLHSNEKEQFHKLFDRDKIDRFEERFIILEKFLQVERHITLSDFLALFVDQNVKVDPKLVSDTLKLMCRYGFARKHRFASGDVRYEHMHLGQHHDHMICVKCNGIFEFEDDRLELLQANIASSHGFHVLQHKMELYGVCHKCMRDHEKLTCLADASQGERLVIAAFSGGKKFVSRLSSVGLRIGDEVSVIANSGRGQLVIAVGHRRLVLSRGFAQKLFVNIKMNNTLSDTL